MARIVTTRPRGRSPSRRPPAHGGERPSTPARVPPGPRRCSTPTATATGGLRRRRQACLHRHAGCQASSPPRLVDDDAATALLWRVHPLGTPRPDKPPSGRLSIARLRSSSARATARYVVPDLRRAKMTHDPCAEIGDRGWLPALIHDDGGRAAAGYTTYATRPIASCAPRHRRPGYQGSTTSSPMSRRLGRSALGT
jgi:hypothetical protein